MIYYDNTKVIVDKNKEKLRVTKITIDTSGWVDDNPTFVKYDTYPYVVQFTDAAEGKHRAVTDEYKSNAFKELLDDLQKRYGAVITDYTKVEVIMPNHVLREAGYKTFPEDRGYVFACEMRDLEVEGMDALDSYMYPSKSRLADIVENKYKPTKIMKRLQTCLDEALHQGELGKWLWYLDGDRKKSRTQLFPLSASHYDKCEKVIINFRAYNA